LLKKDALSSSKSGEYTGEWLPLKYMLLWDRRLLLCILLSVIINQQVVKSILVLSLYTVIHSCTWKYANMSQPGNFTNFVQVIAFILSTRN
jgi:hypothetical protein